MKYLNFKLQKIILIFSSIAIGLLYGCNENNSADHKSDINEILLNEANQSGEFAVPAPPFSNDYIFPCSECHAYQDTNPERRELVDMHNEIDAIFDHGRESRWCLDCHDIEDRNHLKLASGKLIPFEESYKLCGQCHGDKLRDWKVGVHGKRTGEWNGQKQYLLCVHCHNPHSPKFDKIKPEPPPIRQEDLINQKNITE